jgi:hypothetical protein
VGQESTIGLILTWNLIPEMTTNVKDFWQVEPEREGERVLNLH